MKINGILAERIFDQPLLLEQTKLGVISSFLEDRINSSDLSEQMAFGDRDSKEPNSLLTKIENVGVISIIGTLVHRGGFMNAMSGIVSYQQIQDSLIEAAEDSSINTIVLDIDSGGGEVEGNFNLARLIRTVNDDIKPVIAIANGHAYSGAYSLAAAAGKFFVTETGGVGSIGVVVQHADFSEANKKAGVKITTIFAGDKKIDGSSDFPLSPSAANDIQERINILADMFISHVAEMRSISKESVKNTQAGCLFAEKAVNMEFVDGIISFDELVGSLINEIEPALELTETRQRIEHMFPRKNKITKTEKVSEEVASEKIEANTEVEAEAESAEEVIEITAPETVDLPEENSEESEMITETDPAERAAMISDMCVSANMSSSISDFIRSDMSVEDIKEKLDVDKQIEQVCILANKPNKSAAFIKDGTSLKDVQQKLIDDMSESQPEISSTQSVESMEKDFELVKSNENVVLANAIARREAKQK